MATYGAIANGALLRAAALLLIPVGGWVGGALMERVLDAILGA